MSTQYIADQKICFSLQGLRWIEKVDQTSYEKREEIYRLRLQYKGSYAIVIYEDWRERDETYYKAVRALTKQGDGDDKIPLPQTNEKRASSIFNREEEST